MHYQRLASDVDLSEEAEQRRIEAGDLSFAETPDDAAPGAGADAPAAVDVELAWLSDEEEDFAEWPWDAQTTSKPEPPACGSRSKPADDDFTSCAAPAPAFAPREEEHRRPVAPAPKAPRIVPASQAVSTGGACEAGGVAPAHRAPSSTASRPSTSFPAGGRPPEWRVSSIPPTGAVRAVAPAAPRDTERFSGIALSRRAMSNSALTSLLEESHCRVLKLREAKCHAGAQGQWATVGVVTAYAHAMTRGATPKQYHKWMLSDLDVRSARALGGRSRLLVTRPSAAARLSLAWRGRWRRAAFASLFRLRARILTPPPSPSNARRAHAHFLRAPHARMHAFSPRTPPSTPAPRARAVCAAAAALQPDDHVLWKCTLRAGARR